MQIFRATLNNFLCILKAVSRKGFSVDFSSKSLQLATDNNNNLVYKAPVCRLRDFGGAVWEELREHLCSCDVCCCC